MSWGEIPTSELADWNHRLSQAPTASIRQYPLFNEGLRGSGGLWVTIPGRFASAIALGRRWTTTPQYLVYRAADGKTVFACVVSIGVPGVRVGCILDGPVPMDGCSIDPVVVRDLVSWARRNHYIALRVTHSNEAFLHTLSQAAMTERVDGVPFYPYPTSELYVDISRDEQSILAGFQTVARRNVRQARDAGYLITVDSEPHAMMKAWPAFQSRSAQKGISYRDLETYVGMMNEAQVDRAAHLYIAWLGEKPIAAILNLRDRTTAHYFLGTIDVDALGDAPSPACLLHWHAMRHAVEMGATHYNLGTRSGPVYTFKSKFRPVEREHPQPLTIVVNAPMYRLWRRLLPSVARVVR